MVFQPPVFEGAMFVSGRKYIIIDSKNALQPPSNEMYPYVVDNVDVEWDGGLEAFLYKPGSYLQVLELCHTHGGYHFGLHGSR